MITRKAQLTGGSTFTVSLPKEWARNIDLETSDTLRLFPRNRTLIIEPEGGDEYWDVTVDIDGFSETKIRRTIQALYTTGFNRLTLSAPVGLEDHRRVISTTARKLIGLETIESTETQVTLQSLLDPATVSVQQSTIQLRQVTLSMHEDAIQALLKRDEDLAELVADRDNQVDRLYGMITRHFQRSLIRLQETEELALDQSELYDFQTTARQLERFADHAEKVSNLAVQFENPPPDDFGEDIESVADRSREVVKQAASTIIGDADLETAHDALDLRDDVTNQLETLQRRLHERESAKGDIDDGHLIALTLDSMTRTAEYGANIAETALQSAARDRRL